MGDIIVAFLDFFFVYPDELGSDYRLGCRRQVALAFNLTLAGTLIYAAFSGFLPTVPNLLLLTAATVMIVYHFLLVIRCQIGRRLGTQRETRWWPWVFVRAIEVVRWVCFALGLISTYGIAEGRELSEYLVPFFFLFFAMLGIAAQLGHISLALLHANSDSNQWKK